MTAVRLSRELDLLSGDAHHLLAWTFRAHGAPCLEVRLGEGDAEYIAARVYSPLAWLTHHSHAGDPAYAVVYAHECSADPERGAEILPRFLPGRP